METFYALEINTRENECKTIKQQASEVIEIHGLMNEMFD